LPLLGHFNHCIAAVEWNGQKIFLDGTIGYCALGTLPFSDLGAKTAIIKPDGAELAVTPAYAADNNVWRENMLLTLEEGGDADLELDFGGRGQTAFFIRSWFRDENICDDTLKIIAGEKFGHVSAGMVNSVRPGDLTGEKPAADEAEVDGRLRLRSYAKPAAGGWVCRVPPPLLNGKFCYDGVAPTSWAEAFAPNSRRDCDFVLPAALTVKRSLLINFPDAWRLTNALQPVAIKEKFGELKVKFKPVAGSLEIAYELRLTSPRVAVADYPAFRRFCLAADKMQNLDLRFAAEADPDETD
jgi:hypothetical protein